MEKRFTRQKELGGGGQGRVFLVRDALRPDEPLALKRLVDDSQRRILEMEFSRLSALKHPNLARAYDFFRDKEGPYFTSEFIDGVDILTWSRGADEDAILRVLADLLAALALIHSRGWVHGDLSPANVLVECTHSNQATVKLLDLGSARRIGERALATTAGFSAPEVLRENGVRVSSDLYSFGVLMVRALFNAHPFGTGDASSIATAQMTGNLTLPNVTTSPLLTLGERLLIPDPEKRPESAARTLALLSDAAGRELRKGYADCKGGDLPGPKFVGRRREASIIEEMLIQTHTGGVNRVARITGPKGSGKSALLGELVRFAQLEGFEVIGRVDAPATTSGIIGQLVNALGEDSLDGETRALISPWRTTHSQKEPAQARTNAEGLQFATARMVSALASSRPVLVVVDDVEKTERTVKEILSAITRCLSPDIAPRPEAALLITQDVVQSRQSGWHSEEKWIPLNPLGKENIDELVSSMFPGVVYDEKLRDAIYLVSKGWPGSAEQNVRQSAGHQSAENLEDAAKKQIRSLDSPSRNLLTGLSFLDRPVKRASVTQLAGITKPLRRLIKMGFVEERDLDGGRGLRVPPSLGKIAVDMAGTARANPLGRDLATVLLREGELETAATLICNCGEANEGSRIFAQIARESREKGDLVGAGEWFEKALENAGDEADVIALAEDALPVFEATGQIELARDAIKKSGLSSREKAQKQAHLTFLEGHHQDAHSLAKGLVKRYPKDLFSANLLAKVKTQLGQYEQCLATALETLKTPPKTGDPIDLLSEMARTGAVAATCLGRLDQAEKLLLQAKEGFSKTQDKGGQINVLADQGLLARRTGDLRAAHAYYDRAVQRAMELGNKRLEGLHRMNRGAVALVTGNIRGAVVDYEAAQEIAIVLGNAFARAQVEVNLSDLLSGAGKQNAAFRLATQAATRCRALGQTRLESRAHLMAGTALLRLEDLPRAENRLLRAKRGFDATGDDVGRLSYDLLFAELRFQKGDFIAATRFGSQAAEAAREAKRPGHRARALTILARAEMAQKGDAARAVANLNAANQLLKEESLPDEAWRTQVHLADALRMTSANSEAAAAMDLAREGFERVKQSLPKEWVLSFSNYAEAKALGILHKKETGETRTSPSEDLEKLMEVNRELTRERNLKRLLALIMSHAVDLTGAERGMVLIKRKGSVESVISHQISEAEDVNFSRSVAAEVLREGQAMLAIDALGDDRFRSFESVHAMKLRSILAVPLRIRTNVVGAIYLDSKLRTGVFQETDRELLEAFGSQAAIALETARLISENEKRLADLETANAQVSQLSQQLADRLKRNEAKLIDVGALLTKTQKGEADRLRENGMIGRSYAMRRVMHMVDRVATTDVPVYIFGASGTGKELLARAIHAESSRRDNPFVPVNCGALPPKLLASELFGHKKGAFTGASGDRPGLFRLAHEGTLFLDEVSSMDAEMQAYLLRVLQDGTFRSLGGTEEISVDVRILSASNRDLADEVANGRFREDLLYRLNVVRVNVPPLSSRREDIPLLVEHFASQYSKDAKKHFSKEALAHLMRADWPGNVRELENEVLRSIALSDSERPIEPKDLSSRLSQGKTPVVPTGQGTLKNQVDQFEMSVLERVLEECDGNASLAAKQLGISRAGFYKKLEKYPGLRD